MGDDRMSQFIATTNINREDRWIQGFDITGSPIFGIRETARKYPWSEWARRAAHNAIRANRTDHLPVSHPARIEEV
jgi:hypothetical protein